MNYLRNFVLGGDENDMDREASNIERREFHLKVLDHITPHISSENLEQDTIVVLIKRFWVSRLDDDRQFLLFVHPNDDGKLCSLLIPSFGVPISVSLPAES